MVLSLLLNILKDRSISFRALAKQSGVPFRTLENWYYRGDKPPIDKAEKVLNVLGYTIEIKKV